MNVNEILLNLKKVVNKQDKSDSRLLTNSKDIVGAINENKSSLEEKVNIVVCEEVPPVKKKNTFYFKVTEKQSTSGGNQNIKVSPNMGIKIV